VKKSTRKGTRKTKEANKEWERMSK
jgi:hypothetical protein